MNFRGLLPTDPARRITRASVADHPTIRAALATLSGAADLTQYAPKILDQGRSSTCWAHSAATLLFTRRAVRGVEPLSLASPLYFAQTLYASLRADAHLTGALPVLTDDGAQLDDAARCFARWGSVRFGAPQQSGDTDVPATTDAEGNPLALPELAVAALETGATVPFGGEYDIPVTSSAGDLCAAALEAGVPIWLGGPVGQNLQTYEAGTIEQPVDPNDPTIGGHARAVLGYRTVGGAREWLIRNSWGARWGDHGDSWASEAVLLGAWSLLPFEVS